MCSCMFQILQVEKVKPCVQTCVYMCSYALQRLLAPWINAQSVPNITETALLSNDYVDFGQIMCSQKSAARQQR